MDGLFQLIEQNVLLAWVVVVAAFAVLAKCADIFVESAVALAERFKVPKLVIGIVLVSLATTAPELAVSVTSAARGSPEIALGNAVGSVICDDGLALGLCGIISAVAIFIAPRLLKSAAVFIVSVDVLIFLFVAFDRTLSRWEGAVLICAFVGYVFFLYDRHRKGVLRQDLDLEELEDRLCMPLRRILVLFALSLVGILISSEFVVVSSVSIARAFRLPESVIALTLVALGTSIPEVATCVAAAVRRHGEVALGNILGADIMNVCWVAGASAMVNDLTLGKKEIYFMFPSMFIIVGAMLLMLFMGYRLTRAKGVTLLVLYVVYLCVLFLLFPPQVSPH
jgi:cation:H+ antiporter